MGCLSVQAWCQNSPLVKPLKCSLSWTKCAKILGQNQFDWPIAARTKRNYGGSDLMYIVPPLGPTYIGESAKAYKSEVLIWRTSWGTFSVPIRNLKRTLWEHIRKQGKLKKKNLRSPPPHLKGIKARHLRPSYWLKGK
jgi:hypothetical protein